MNKIDRYFARTVIAGTSMVLLVIVPLVSLINFINEIGEVGRSNYTVFHAIYYILLSIPRQIYEFFPTAVLIGSLLGLGNLAAHAELTAIRAAGVSKHQILFSVLKTGFFILVFVLLFGEFVMPPSSQNAQSVHKVARNESVELNTRDGLWAKVDNRFVNVKEVYPDKRLSDIRIYVFSNAGHLVSVSHAESAIYHPDNYWIVRNVRRSDISEQDIKFTESEEEFRPNILSPDMLKVLTIEPEQMSAWTLVKYLDYLRQNNLATSHYELALWTRFTNPVSSLVMLLLAVPFVFGMLRSGGIGKRIIIGILIGLGAFIITQMFNNVSLVYGFSPFLGATLPVIVFFSAGVIGIRRMR